MSNSLRRKIERSKKKQKQKDIKEKMGLFDKIPDCCLVCEKAFDKKDKEMIMTWNVIVRDQEKKVNLYCPSCWDKANEILEDFKNHLQEKS